MSPDGLKPPPEEKLLRLIRGKIGHATAGGTTASTAAPAGSASIGQLVGRAQRLNWSQAATVGLIAILGLEAVWVVVQLVRPLPAMTVPAVQVAPSMPDPSAAVAPAIDIPSLATTATRPLFTAPAGGGEDAGAARPSMSGSAKVLASRLTLTGIVAGATPQAIIEDTQTQKTYLVSVGQPLAEGAVLDQILDNRVILDFNGEKVELAL